MEPITLYHGTTKKALAEIYKNGLKPFVPSQADYQPSGVYFWRSLKDARKYAKAFLDKDATVITVTFPAELASELEDDTEMEGSDCLPCLMFPRVVSPEFIVRDPAPIPSRVKESPLDKQSLKMLGKMLAQFR